MHKKSFLIFLFMSFVYLNSCNYKINEYEPVDYINWVNNPKNGLISETISGEYTYALQYRPQVFLSLLEAGSNELTHHIIDSIEHSFSGMQQFLFKVSLNNGSSDWLQSSTKNFDNYDEQIKYLSFSMQNDFIIIRKGDTLDCSMFHFERDYGIRPFGTFLLGFPIETDQMTKNDTTGHNESFKVIYKDSAFGDEVVEFNFSSNDINKIPTLKL